MPVKHCVHGCLCPVQQCMVMHLQPFTSARHEADICHAGDYLGRFGYTGVQVSPPHEDIVVEDYPDTDKRQEPW